MDKTLQENLDISIYDLKMSYIVKLYGLCAVILLGFTIYFAISMIIPQTIVCAIGFTALASVSYLSSKRYLSLKLSTNVFNLLILLIVFTTFFTSGGLRAPSLFWIPTICFSTLILLGRRTMYFWFASAGIVVTGAFIAQSSGYQFKSSYSEAIIFKIHFAHFIFLTLFTISLATLQTKLQSKLDEYRENLHTKLYHENRLSSLGHLSAGISHELNNPLTIAMLNMNRLQSNLNEPEDTIVGKSILKTQNALERMKNIVSSVSVFSRSKDNSTETFEVGSTISGTIKLFEEMFTQNNIDLRFENDVESVFINGNLQQFSQVIINLITNSKDSFVAQNKSDKYVSIKMNNSKGMLKITIEDNGSGIPKDTLTKIFDSFYTTKEVGKGTGLGLSISKSFINQMGGEITCESKEGSGTKFTITLPQATMEIGKTA